MNEKTTIVVSPRDRFSTAGDCLNNILKNTPEPYDLIAVMGGCPAHIERDLRDRFGERARLIFEPRFLNTAQARNRGLKISQTRLTLFLDTDVYVRPGWYEPLLRCQKESGAAMVGPMILDRQNQIHAAGNNFYITREHGQDYATMEIRYAAQVVGQMTNIRRQESDFLEIHCQLTVTDIAKRLDIYDENLREFHEMDSGLKLTRGGCLIVFEPESRVYLHYSERLKAVEDIDIFCWKWDMDAMRDGFAYFKRKWGYDLNHRGRYDAFLEQLNHRCNFMARHWPSKTSILLDQYRARLFKTIFRYWE